MAIYDVAIVGAGVTGSAVARELSRRKGALCCARAGPGCVRGAPARPIQPLCTPGSTRARHHESENERAGQPDDGPALWGSWTSPPPNEVGSFVVCFSKEEGCQS